MRHVRVRKHSEFQHYKDRNPPWIKWHARSLTSYSFNQLTDAQRFHAIQLAVLATQYENHIPGDGEKLGYKIRSKSPVDLERLVEVGFLEWCSCTECEQTLAGASKVLAREEERRVEAEESREDPLVAASDDLLRVWEAYDRAHRHICESNGKRYAAYKLTAPRRKLIRKAIKTHSVKDAMQAAVGIFMSEFHVGNNDRGTAYVSPEVAFSINAQRDNVERFSRQYEESDVRLLEEWETE